MRLGLAGCGTDFEPYYTKYGGAVVVATIDKYCYALLSPTDSPTVQIGNSEYDGLLRLSSAGTVRDGHSAPLVLEHFGIRRGVSVFLTSELPPHTGMAISGSSAVALIRAAAEYRGEQMSPTAIAELACEIEIDKLGTPTGKQDVYSSALGGLNFLQFRSEGVNSEPLQVSPGVLEGFGQRLMLFFTGRTQERFEVLAEYKRATERNRASVINALHETKAAAVGLRGALEEGKLDRVGAWLHQAWSATRQLARGMTDPWIDQWYETARAAGAEGGGTAGLGGTGFLFLYCPIERQSRVEQALDAAGLKRVDFRLVFDGVDLILKEQAEPFDRDHESWLAGAKSKRARH